MDLYAYLVVLFVVLGFILVLPLVSGTFSYKLATPGGKKGFGKESSSSKSSRSKNGARFKIELNHTGPNTASGSRTSTLRKRQGFTIDNDPNTFDYDLTELIEEDQREEQREQELRYQRLAGREQENNELLV
ncbi:Exp1p LALA0_S03e01420g [Lachancea lanzarotensis]|uniref:LALA0S03e01420g1_1 n=1 Tax=Lachancea lanzarotensis TaxID=1245769 RepID=A0A0C7MV04_9SACH|nr:uncharacterized protein LALA0_S03e01420g [Lachancea lanzarotensis]CEP61373.1 LALA0S03e01420g1_1 [Lachancea lanzarotensis]